MPKKNNPGYVTMAECTRISRRTNAELVTIKKALIGADMRGGVVKDVADIKATIKNNHRLGKAERAMIYTSLVSVVGLIIAELIKTFG